ncbi:hypothetical protein JCM8115_001564, partial [Rhodotorula mucilaginosa]
MPSTSSLTSHEKALVKKYAPTAHKDKIHAAAIGRVYYAYPDPAKWSYSGIAGAVTFGWGANGGWIKVVDLAGTRGVIWQHAVLADMPYYQDRTFFHTFPSDDCMIGIAFSSESEAAELFKKVSMRNKYAAKFSQGGGGGGSATPPPGSASSHSHSPSKLAALTGRSSKRKSGAPIDKSLIGAPTGFSHVAHMGFDASQGFTSRNIDPSWERLFQQLESQGISRSQIEKNEDFIRNFVQGSGGPTAGTARPTAPPPPPPPPPAAAAAAASGSSSSRPSRPPPPPAPPTSSSKRVPPPAPPSRGAPGGAPHRIARKPPPPPSRGTAPSPAAPFAAPPPPPPPPPPARGVPAPPPPPPARGGAAAPPPPPPPPPPPSRAPPGAGAGAPPPPPPPPPAAMAPPPGGDTRNALLASIQGKSVNNLRK